MPNINVNIGLLTSLVARWHSETPSFHLPTGEATVTLKDVWHILCIPIHGERVIFNPSIGMDALCRLFKWELDDIEVTKREI